MPELTPGTVIAGVAVLLLGSYLMRMLGHPGEAKALEAVARKRGWTFVPGTSGGPAIRIPAPNGEGEARFRAGKRRFLLGRHLRVRLPLPDAGGMSLRIVPPMRKRGRAMQMVHPAPATADDPRLDTLYDVHASSRELLRSALADGTADTLIRSHPNLWLQVRNGRIEVRLAGERDERLVNRTIDLALGLRARIAGASG
jgi:hypothetical protein